MLTWKRNLGRQATRVACCGLAAVALAPAATLAQDSWTPTSTSGAPAARNRHTAVWTGTRMIVWGGNVSGGITNTGGVFDPVANVWGGMPTGGAPVARTYHAAVWTGTRMIVWGGSDGTYSGFLDSGGIYDPATGTWAPTSTTGAPAGRAEATAVWTGSKMIVWGGSNFATSTYYATGGIYDPATSTWQPTSAVGAPTARRGHTAVWTGSRMIVFGGWGSGGYDLNTGGSYDPATDSWTSLSTSGVQARSGHSALWTGSRMLVWGGGPGYALPAGEIYDPATDTWADMGTTGTPTPRANHEAVWTGSKMIVWGGYRNGAIGTGGVYDPAADAWVQTTTLGEPSPRWDHTAVWTGSRMVIWGGYGAGQFANTGGIYDPGFAWLHLRKGGAGAGTVQSVPAGISCGTSCLSASAEFLAGTLVELTATPEGGSVFAGWSGACSGLPTTCQVSLNATATVVASFLPRDLACRLRVTKAGSGEGGVTSNPTGIACDRMCAAGEALFACGTTVSLSASAWGGSDFTGWEGACAGAAGCEAVLRGDTLVWAKFHRPELPGQWRGLGPVAPRRYTHSAVWTGSKMIVWGGQSAWYTPLNTGSVHDVASDTWSATSITGAPSARSEHVAVWTGSRMVVWGGDTLGARTDTGGVYDPVTDSWTTTSTVGAPAPRRDAVAVWTGSRMIVWGGFAQSGGTLGSGLQTGGLYDPDTDTWTPMSATGAPIPMYSNAGVWTGSRLIVWTDQGGGSYDPATDAWTPLAASGAPSWRRGFTAVWTGTRMIVWGGETSGGFSNSGRLYDPSTDAWTPSTTAGAPSGRAWHSAVWTGTRMIVWGGEMYGSALPTGGIYDSSTDSWAATSTAAAPTAREGHTALWAGDQMIVWGGWDISSSGYASDTGGIYDPSGSSGSAPDLVAVIQAVGSGTAEPGSTVAVAYQVANLGNAASGASTLKLWLSPDDTLDGTDSSLVPAGLAVGALAAGQSVAATATVTIPGGTAMKIWRLIAQADALDAVAEASETNNSSSRAFRIDRRAAVDFNADGQADLLWHHQLSGDLYTWQLQGTVTTAGAYLTPKSFADTRWQIRGLADFNRDGNVDVLWHHQVTGDLYVWFLNGTVTVGGSYLTPKSFADTRWQIRGVAEFDGDGKPDLLWHHQVTGDLYIWFLDGTVTVRGSYLTPPTFADTRWQIRGISDFNADGRADVLWHHQGNGDLYVWYLYATTTVAGSYLTPKSFADTRWKIVTVADFDGDGNKDVLWHHQGNGDLYVWFLEGTVTVDGAYLDPARFSDVNWKVVPR